MNAAEAIRDLARERCSVAEVAEYLGVPLWYVRQVLRRVGMMDRAPGRPQARNVVAAFSGWLRAA